MSPVYFNLCRVVCSLIFVFICGTHLYAQNLRVGIALPLTGEMQQIGTALEQAINRNASHYRNELELFIHDGQCNEQGGIDSAKYFIENQIDIVISSPCLLSLNGLQSALPDTIPIISPFARAPTFYELQNGRVNNLFHLSTSYGQQNRTIVDLIIEHWPEGSFLMLDDGTPLYYEISENIRFLLEEADHGPVGRLTFQPGLSNQALLARQIGQQEDRNLFIAGARTDIETIVQALGEVQEDYTILLYTLDALFPMSGADNLDIYFLAPPSQQQHHDFIGHMRQALTLVQQLAILRESQPNSNLLSLLRDNHFQIAGQYLQFDERGYRQNLAIRIISAPKQRQARQ